MNQRTFLGLTHNPFTPPREGFFSGGDRKSHILSIATRHQAPDAARIGVRSFDIITRRGVMALAVESILSCHGALCTAPPPPDR